MQHKQTDYVYIFIDDKQTITTAKMTYSRCNFEAPLLP